MAIPSKPDQQALRTSLLLLSEFETSDVERLWELFLAKMTLLYFPPFRAETEAELLDQCIVGLADYIDALKQFSNGAIQEGWSQVRNNHRTPRWPIIGDLVDACRQHVAPTHAASSGPAKPWKPRAEVEAERPSYQEFAQRNASGHRDAAKAYGVDDGTLFRWLRDNGRQPTDEDWACMQAFSARVRAKFAGSGAMAEVVRMADRQLQKVSA
jgi:hypothetical protein